MDIPVQVEGKIIRVEQITRDIFRHTVIAPKIAKSAIPGQFVMVRTGNYYDPLLRRPFSIHQVGMDGTIQILFKSIGKGTKLLSEKHENQELDILGPLGRGFARVPGKKYLIGGGLGIAPLLFLTQWLLSEDQPGDIKILLGSGNRQEIDILIKNFEAFGVETVIATDDGSLGHHGFITDLLKEEMSERWSVYTCGPYPMLKKIVGMCRAEDRQCQVSLESMMACGFSACLGCAIKKGGIKPVDEMSYLHVCKDGPVFMAGEVAWE